MRREYPILEHDPTKLAVIEPNYMAHPADMPEHCVPCFFLDVIDKLREDHDAELVTELTSEAGKHPVYALDIDGRKLGVFHPGVGAPIAATLLEEVIARGGSKFIACGGAGVLNKDIRMGNIVVPAAAIRDEGTSYHYLPPGREVNASPLGVAAIEAALTQRGYSYLVSKTWTTDAIYRETPAKVELRRSEGCTMVDMEAAAFFAVAQFRGVTFAQILYGGDDVSGTQHDPRPEWTRHSVREELFWVAAQACLSL